jgi:hypothetical protein
VDPKIGSEQLCGVSTGAGCSRVTEPYFINLMLIEFRPVPGCPTLAASVLVILCGVTPKKMIRVYA